MVNAADLGLRVSHTVWALSLVLQLMQVIVLGKVGLVLNPMFVYVSLLYIVFYYCLFALCPGYGFRYFGFARFLTLVLGAPTARSSTMHAIAAMPKRHGVRDWAVHRCMYCAASFGH